MDPSQIVHLFANPWTAAVSVLAVVVETMPAEWVAIPASVRRWIGWLAVLTCAPVAVLLHQDIAGAMMAGAMGLAGSWLLLEVVEAGAKRQRGRRMVPVPNHIDALAMDSYARFVRWRAERSKDVGLSPQIDLAWEHLDHGEQQFWRSLHACADPDIRAADTGEPPPLFPPPPVK